MSLLISSPSFPGNKIDDYVQPLIEELKELWINRVDPYDGSQCQTSKLSAVLLWTIKDFPAYSID